MPDGFEVRGVYVTPHAARRMRQRLGLNRSALEREVGRVLEYGVDGRETKGRLKRWVDRVMWRQDVPGTVVMLTTAGAFIIRNDTVVTVLPVTGSLVREVKEHMKKGETDGEAG